MATDELHPKVGIEIRKEQCEWVSVFIAIHDVDLDICFANGEEVLLYRGSVDVYLGGLQRLVTFNVYK